MEPTLKDTHISAWEALPVDIAANAAFTNTINVGGLRLFAIVMPTDWTSANLTFQISTDGGTSWKNLKDQKGNEVTALTEASACIALDATQFAAFQYIRLRSGTNSTPVTQTATRTLQLLLRSI